MLVTNAVRQLQHFIGLAELELIDPDLASAEWLAMYRYWLGEE